MNISICAYMQTFALTLSSSRLFAYAHWNSPPISVILIMNPPIWFFVLQVDFKLLITYCALLYSIYISHISKKSIEKVTCTISGNLHYRRFLIRHLWKKMYTFNIRYLVRNITTPDRKIESQEINFI